MFQLFNYVSLLSILWVSLALQQVRTDGDQPLSNIAIYKTEFALHDMAYINASPSVLGVQGANSEWVTLDFEHSEPSTGDWIGVFSPANFSAATCAPESARAFPPLLCTAPIKMTVTWTSGYGINEAEPFVGWGPKKGERTRSPAGTLTFQQNSMCGAPARTVGWRDPGFIHTSFLKELWPNSKYTYRLGHRLLNGTYVWSRMYQFKSSPYPGQASLQKVVIFGDMGKDEIDGSNEYNNFQRGSLNTTKQLINDLENIDIVFHIGDICYANGYLSQWDQFTAQIEPIASKVPYMLASGNHERDWPGSGSFYGSEDSGGECGVPAQAMFYTPAENRAKFWYATDYGMFRFCIAHTEEDWREGTDQYKFIEHCLASVDRQKQPWLIFLAHRVLGYSSNQYYANEGTTEEPMGRESLQKLWQKYKVDIAIFGHVHNYERTCPIYQNTCTRKEKDHYEGPLNGTIHIVAGGAGASLTEFSSVHPKWSLFRDFDYGFTKLTAFDHSNLLFEYKKSRDGKVYDSFRISRDYRDILACAVDSCAPTTLAT
ncbi:putative inactive purple acid phosphatase 1 isoform X2 [Silene latifolia]|uniref:putative inactive purple acid phosphatase 1 isoform X2 n=1 Tax=Silene latifolia TaxID=37657 RepID=UPI003D773883